MNVSSPSASGNVMEPSQPSQPPLLKMVNRTWKTLPDKGEDVYIRDPKLKEGYIGDLSKKSVTQLQEIVERHDRILKNKFLSSKLKDKGEKLRECRDRVAEALRERLGENENGPTKDTPADINAMEWKSRRKEEKKRQELDSDDDDDDDGHEDRLDPLRLMAYHSSCVKKPALPHHNGTREEEEDPTNAIVQELKQLELQDAKHQDTKQESRQHCEFGERRDRMLQEMKERNGPVRDSFKPFRPVSNPLPIPGLVHHTPRPNHCTTKCLPQQEALKLEREFLIKEKERVLSDTRNQLGKRRTEKVGLPSAASSLRYRDTNVDKHFLESEDESDGSSDLDDAYDYE